MSLAGNRSQTPAIGTAEAVIDNPRKEQTQKFLRREKRKPPEIVRSSVA